MAEFIFGVCCAVGVCLDATLSCDVCPTVLLFSPGHLLNCLYLRISLHAYVEKPARVACFVGLVVEGVGRGRGYIESGCIQPVRMHVHVCRSV